MTDNGNTRIAAKAKARWGVTPVTQPKGNPMIDLIEQDAAEVRGMLAAREWRKALLIARCVDATGTGGRPVTGPNGPVTTTKKDSATAFANRVGVSGWSRKTAIRHIEAWDNAAKDGLVPESKDLVPGQEVENLPADDLWNNYYPPGGTDLQRATPEEKKEFQRVADEVDTTAGTVARFASSPKGVAGAILVNDKVFEEAKKAVQKVQEQKDRDAFNADIPDDILDASARVKLAEGLKEPTPLDHLKDQIDRDAKLIARGWKWIEDLKAAGPWGDETSVAPELRNMAVALVDLIVHSDSEVTL